MIPHQPHEAPEQAMQDEVLQAVHDALSETAPSTSSESVKPVAETSSPALLSSKEAEELDRVEAYLKGPTAFTA
jgi:hypothetical protein